MVWVDKPGVLHLQGCLWWELKVFVVFLLIGPMPTRARECQPTGFLEWMQTMKLCTAVLGQIFSAVVHFTVKGVKLYDINEQIQPIIRFFVPFSSFSSADKVGRINYALRKNVYYVYSDLLLGS